MATAAEHQIGSKSKEVGWYDPPITAVPPPVRDLLENYSGYAPDEVVPRTIEMRDKIWDVFPWPCVGQFRFLDLSLSRQGFYADVLARLRDEGATFLDVGCCFAQDLRKLVHDGAPPQNLYGLEKQAEFITLASDFFRDADRLPPAQFLHADLLDREDDGVKKLAGSVDILQLGMILHVWDREGQTEACKRVVELLRPVKGSLVIGQSVGHLDGVESAGKAGKKIFKQNAETFAAMWEEVGRATGTKWEVDARLDEGLGISEQNRGWDDPRTRRLYFKVQRL